MFDFTVCAGRGAWRLQDGPAGELGAYPTCGEALAAAAEWMPLIERPWPLLVCEADGEWPKTIVQPTAVH